MGGTRITSRERGRIAAAFRRIARGLENKEAYRSTLEFYRATQHDWTRQLG